MILKLAVLVFIYLATAAKAEDSNSAGVTCHHQKIGAPGKPEGRKLESNDGTKDCCRGNGECKKNVIQSKSIHYCIVKSKVNEDKAKQCCADKSKGDKRWWGESQKIDSSHTEKMKAC